jgi:hypothetical protein
MTLRKLDQNKPPPGFLPGQSGGYYQPCCGYNKDAAWDEYHERSAPAVDDALARLVEWLRETQPTTTPDLLADAIESGEWRND